MDTLFCFFTSIDLLIVKSVESVLALPVDSVIPWLDKIDASTETSPLVASGFFKFGFEFVEIYFWSTCLDIYLIAWTPSPSFYPFKGDDFEVLSDPRLRVKP